MTKRLQADESRTRLIQAARTVLQTEGMRGLTLDAVARTAGISKGGLLHHFRSKNELIEAILRQLFADFRAQVAQALEQEPSIPGRWLRAYVRATFADDPVPLELSTLLLSALVDETLLLRLIQEEFGYWDERLLNDGIPAPRARVIRQAADFYWTERLLELGTSDAATRQALLDELLALTEVAR